MQRPKRWTRLTADDEACPEGEELDPPRKALDEAAAQRAGFGPYIPGVGADVARSGQVREIRGDLFDYIIWNLHYQATGKPETARPSHRGVAGDRSEHAAGSPQRTLALREIHFRRTRNWSLRRRCRPRSEQRRRERPIGRWDRG